MNYATGINSKGIMEIVRVSNGKSRARNPAFDATPAKYVSGIITPGGIIKANSAEIGKILGRRKN